MLDCMICSVDMIYRDDYDDIEIVFLPIDHSCMIIEYLIKVEDEMRM